MNKGLHLIQPQFDRSLKILLKNPLFSMLEFIFVKFEVIPWFELLY
jgi:hypothetical protein